MSINSIMLEGRMAEAMVVTNVRISRAVWLMLRELAERRAISFGGRASVSAVVAELAEKAVRTEAPRVE